MTEGESGKRETGDYPPHVLPSWDESGLVTIVETAENVKEELEREGASYTELGLAQMVDWLLKALGGCDKTTEQKETFKRLNEVWRREK